MIDNNLIFTNDSEYPCPYKNNCPIEIGSNTCFCKRKLDYYQEQEKENI